MVAFGHKRQKSDVERASALSHVPGMFLGIVLQGV
jgi:hypothetical protein